MLDWLIGSGINKLLGLLFLAVIYPVYKTGTYIRQGLVYQDDISAGRADMKSRGLTFGNFKPEFLATYQVSGERCS